MVIFHFEWKSAIDKKIEASVYLKPLMLKTYIKLETKSLKVTSNRFKPEKQQWLIPNWMM